MSAENRWRLIVDGKLPASRNMAIDEAMFRLCSAGDHENYPVVRFYQWKNPTLSFGSSQQILKVADLDYCKKAGYDIIRRPTGGRAVLHDDEVTYCIVGPVGNILGNYIQETYQLISGAIQQGLILMGVDAGTAGKDKAEKTEKLSYQPCFASATKYELEYKGKKIVGSAQRRDSKAFLQHGSILLNFNEKELLKSIGAEISESDPAEYMTSISKILNYRVGYADAIKKLILGFEETFKIEMVYDKLNPREIEAADFLDSVKYSSEEWNHSK